MHRLFPVLALAGLLAGVNPSSAPAQAPTPTPGPGRTPEWRCTTPGGTYVVALRSIVSISMHEYVVDGAARVTELNIDTTGNALARFYYLEAITPQTPLAVGQSTLNKLQEMAEQASARTGQEEIWQKVTKTYPGSTHAHTIEYRLESKDDLKKIFNSADAALHDLRDGSITIQP